MNKKNPYRNASRKWRWNVTNHKCLTLPLTSVQSQILLIPNLQHSDYSRPLTVVKRWEISASVLECQKYILLYILLLKALIINFLRKLQIYSTIRSSLYDGDISLQLITDFNTGPIILTIFSSLKINKYHLYIERRHHHHEIRILQNITLPVCERLGGHSFTQWWKIQRIWFLIHSATRLDI